MKRAGKRIRRALLALLLALVLTVGISAAVCRVSLKTTEYTAAVRGLTAPLRTVVLSDLHSREYGKDNAALLARAFCRRAMDYDILLVPGDDFGCPGYARLAYCVARSQIERSLPAFQKLAESYGLCK